MDFSEADTVWPVTQIPHVERLGRAIIARTMTPTRMSSVIAVAAAVACQDPVARPPAGSHDPGAARPAPAQAAASAAAPQPPAPPDAQRGPPRVIAMPEPAIALPSQESFQLLDRGRGARAALRYTLGAGTTAMMARSALRSRHVDHGRFGRPVALPAIRDGFEVAIAAEHPTRIALRAAIAAAAAASPDADAYLAPWRTLLQGRPITLEVDDRGAIARIRFDDDPAGAASIRARDELVQRLLSLIVPLPAEPVGTGARWRAVTILRQGPAITKQTATYTLVARGRARWKLHVKLQRVGEQQQIADPSLPTGTSAELLALFRALEGNVEVDPDLPLIAAGSLTIESRLHARLAPPGGPPVEQLFEDTGRVSFTRCRPLPAPRRAPAHPAARRTRQGVLAACPDGFAPA